MQLDIITPDTTIFSGEVNLVQLPGKDGSFEILNMHAPMIAVLKQGKVKIQDLEKKTQFFEIKGGVVEVQNNKVLVLSQ
jgi:F-type H+-transporting ATPase subunit epsilon